MIPTDIQIQIWKAHPVASKNKQALLFPATILLCLVFIYYSDTEHGKKNCQVAFTVQIILYCILPHSHSLSLLYHQHYFLEDLPSAVLWPLPNSITVKVEETGQK